MQVGVDAYVSVAEVAAYLAARGQATAWDATANPAKEAAIVEASSYLDAAFSWVGKIEDSEQPLGWPRICARDREGRTLSGIPQQIKNAACELANFALGGRLMPMSIATGENVLKRERIGDNEFEYDTERYVQSYDYIRVLLRGIGRMTGSGASMVKLVRT